MQPPNNPLVGNGRRFDGTSSRAKVKLKARLSLCALAVPLIGGAGAYAQDYWKQPSGGSWDNPANWSAGASPTINGNSAGFNLATGVPYTVTMGGAEYANNVNVQNTSVTLQTAVGQVLQLGGGLYVNASSGQTAAFTFDGTSVDGSDGSGLLVGGGNYRDYPGSVGGAGTTFFTVNDAKVSISAEPFNFSAGTAVLFNGSAVNAGMYFSGAATFNASTWVASWGNFGSNISVYGPVGAPATLNLSNGSLVSVSSSLTIGNVHAVGPNIVGTGVVNVSASQVTATSGYLDVGGSGGTATLNVTNGGQATGEEIAVGGSISDVSDFGVGTVTVSGARSLAAASDTIAIAAGSTLGVNLGGEVTAAALNLSSGSTLALSLDEGGVDISGLATLAGTLDVTLGSVPDPALGQTFDLLSFGSETGTFSTITLPPLDAGLAWNTQQLYTHGTITVTAATSAPEPGAAGLLAAWGIASLSIRRKRGSRG